MVSFDDFIKLDIRVGKIIEVNDFPEARRPAYKLTIDLGPLGIKKSSAQITDLYEKEELLNREVVCVVNFPPKQIAGYISEVLVLGVYTAHGVVLLKPDRDVPLGGKIGYITC
ncbi:tRNA-binding protein [Calorimonas adulescens]|uniref:tRNA-binding protein n=1 Tax=Calorimonas adulescens TaxID=2606906 RepID=A0A5D8QE70_9THEO|nr:tRNA-binding protein [Calorimonas adulescens]TZE82802.1 tRNA-binding protein [Calorimonas adulescens]